MATFKVETKNKVNIDKKPRVYFTCHPDDFDKHFKKICEDIFKTHDCVVYYTEDMTEVIADDDKQVDLGRNNLFVVPVTFKLLTMPNRAMDEDIPYAFKEHIPVLPIMMETEIDEFYSKPDKFGELQYLNPYSSDLTEIAYEEKLKKYLESVLISDELAERIRAAFDAYIFLSYRKKDRKYANELMRLIHSNPECRDIAVWFDEFLTPGESFKENIEKILDDCKLFTLLVTPQLLEKVVDKNGEEHDNYVISTELPLARKKRQEKGTEIFAVEMEDTDKEALSAISIEDYVNSGDSEFRARLLNAVSCMAVTANNTPEHNFLIGLAYLEGIGVEVNRDLGLSLIRQAAEKNLPEAIKKMVEMYEKGDALPCSINDALAWQNKLIGVLERNFKKTRNDNNLLLVFDARMYCADMYMQIGSYTLAEKKLHKILPLLLARVNKGNGGSGVSYGVLYGAMSAFLKMIHIYENLGDVHACQAILENVQCLFNNFIVSGDTDDTVKTIITDYISILMAAAGFYRSLHDYEKSLEYAERIFRIKENYLHDLEDSTLLLLNEITGDAYFYTGRIQKAQEYYTENYESLMQSVKDDTPRIQRCIAYANNRMGEVMLAQKKMKRAKEFFLYSYNISQGIRNRNKDDDGNIAFCHNRFGDICIERKMPFRALRQYKKAFAIRKRLYEECNDIDATMHLAYSCVNMARTSLFKQKYYYGEAKRLFEILIETSICPDFYREEIRKFIKL